MTFIQRAGYLLQYTAVKTAAAFLQILPLSWVSAIAKSSGDLAYFAMKGRRRTALENLNRAFGNSVSKDHRDRIAQASFRHTALALIELLLVQRTAREPYRHFSIRGQEHLHAARQRGRGILFIISHIGSWEYLAFLNALTGIRCFVVVKDIRNPYVDRLINDCRRQAALTPIPKKNSARKILSVLKDNDLAAILMDQWAGPEGLWIPFFGHETSTTSIAVRIAKKTGAAMVPGRCIRVGDWKYEIQIDPEIPLAEGEDWELKTTLEINRRLEDQIRLFPGQWTWGHKRWKAKPKTLR